MRGLRSTWSTLANDALFVLGANVLAASVEDVAVLLGVAAPNGFENGNDARWSLDVRLDFGGALTGEFVDAHDRVKLPIGKEQIL